MRIDPAGETPLHRRIEEQIRQAVAREALPAGHRLPTIRAMASGLGVHSNTVARAYSTLVQDGVLTARVGRGTFVADASAGESTSAEREHRLGAIIIRALVEAGSLGYSAEQIETGFNLGFARFREEYSRPAEESGAQAMKRSGLTVTGSHDVALGVLANHLRRTPDFKVNVTSTGSLSGLISLARGEADMTACHLLDEATGEYNIPYVQRILKGIPTVIMTLAERVQGLLVLRENPKGIVDSRDLVREDVRLVNRQQGSGTRVLLDHLLARTGADPSHVSGYQSEVDTHLAVASAVASGEADVGLGILAAAKALHLDFIPIESERFDLVVPRAEWDTANVKALRRVIKTTEFKHSVDELGGYDTSRTGEIVVDLPG